MPKKNGELTSVKTTEQKSITQRKPRKKKEETTTQQTMKQPYPKPFSFNKIQEEVSIYDEVKTILLDGDEVNINQHFSPTKRTEFIAEYTQLFGEAIDAGIDFNNATREALLWSLLLKYFTDISFSDKETDEQVFPKGIQQIIAIGVALKNSQYFADVLRGFNVIEVNSLYKNTLKYLTTVSEMYVNSPEKVNRISEITQQIQNGELEGEEVNKGVEEITGLIKELNEAGE